MTTIGCAPLSGVPLERALHLCIDMQRLFAPGGPWPTPWLPEVLPMIEAIVARHAERTVFTRFIPPERPEDLPGRWQAYYHQWREVTGEHLDPMLLRLMPSLDAMTPPALVVDKPVYSAFHRSPLQHILAARGVDTLIITGGETDVCVLATVLDGIDAGYRVVLVTDALCSSSDTGHDALMTLFDARYTTQVIKASTAQLLSAWRP